MIAFLIAMLIVIASIIVFCKTASIANNEDKGVQKRLEEVGCLSTLIVVAITLLVMGTKAVKVIDTTEVGVVKRFGTITHTIDSGFNIINPFTSSVDIYDMRVHIREASFSSYTKDAQPIEASVEYQYELLPDSLMTVAKQFGSYEILESKLKVVVEERAKIVFARYSAMPLLENRSTLSSQVCDEVAELEANFPIHFTSVVVKDIDFSDAFESAVEAKMQAEQNALRAENEKKEAVTRAEQELEVAKIEGEAKIAAAEAEAEAKVASAEIGATAKIAEAEAEARALSIVYKAYGDLPDSWIVNQYISKWDGKLPEYMTGDAANIMLVPNTNDD